jgi:hypothetical protein
VTYSWLKRTSVRTNSASPGFTAATPSLPVLASAIARGDDLLAQRHRPRLGVTAGGAVCRPGAPVVGEQAAVRTIDAEIGSRPLVNSSIGIASPALDARSSEKSVEVRSPMFWQFWP